MLTRPILLLMALPLAPQQPPPKVPGAEVLVEASKLQLPGLPASAKEARSQFKELRPQMAEAIQSLEKELRDLYASPFGNYSLPESFKLPPDRVEEAKGLIGIIQDQAYEDLEERVLESWDRWRDALYESGLAEPNAEEQRIGRNREAPLGHTPSENPPEETQRQKELRRRLKGMQKTKNLQEAESRILAVHFTMPGGGFDKQGFEMAHQAKVEYDGRVQIARAHVAVARQQAPDLSKAWAPLAEHLNGRLLQWVKTEEAAAPTHNPNLLALKLHTRIALLERFRSAFWFAHAIWSHLASEPPPAPLDPLGRSEPTKAAAPEILLNPSIPPS